VVWAGLVFTKRSKMGGGEGFGQDDQNLS